MKPNPTIDLEATEIEREAAPETEADAPDADPPADEPAPAVGDTSLFGAEPRSQLGALIAAGVAGAAISMVLFLILLVSGMLPTGGTDAELGSRVADIELRMTELDRQPAPAVNEGALRGEIQALARQVQDLRSAPAATGTDAALSTRVNELAARLNEVAVTAAETRAPDPAVQEALAGSKSAATLAAIASLESAIARGAPYASALGAVKQRLPNQSYAALDESAERGLLPVVLVAERLAAKLEKAPAPTSSATGFVDRLAEGARGLVRVKPVDGSVPQISADDPWSARNAVTIRLEQGDYANALADWDKLDDIAKNATKAEADALKKRLEANEALDELRGAALAAEKTP